MAKKAPYSASIRVRPKRDGHVSHDVRFRMDGSSKTRGFDDAKSAERWANVLRQIGPEEALKLLDVEFDKTPTVDEYADRYILSKSGLEGMTLDHYRMYMRISISPAMGTLPVDAVTPERISQWVNDQVSAGYSAKTIANRHGFLSAMFQHAVEVTEILRKNPCARTNLPNSEREEMVFLSPDEFVELLSFIPPRWQPLVFLLASTGMRWGEVTALKPGDFDIANRTVTVSRAWKKSRKRGWYVGAPKTKKSKRTIAIDDDALATVLPLIEAADEWVFTNASGKPVRQQHFHGIVWTPARNLANGKPAFAKTRGKGDLWVARSNGVWDREPSKRPIKKMPRIHDLRHSHASWLINAGVPLTAIQLRLGHESVKTTSDTYGHLAPDMLRRSAEVSGVLLAGAMPQLVA
jgi:integrase